MNHLNKRIMQWIATGLLLLASQTVPAVTIFVDPASVNVNNGDSVDVDIMIGDVTDLAGFEFDLAFDTNVLNATLITSGDIFGFDTFGIENTFDNVLGTLGFAEISLGLGVDIGAPVTLATISFDAVGDGVSPLDLSDIVLSDSGGAQISVPLPGTLLLTFAGLLGLRLVR